MKQRGTDKINGYDSTQKNIVLNDSSSTCRLMSGGVNTWEIVWLGANVNF